MTRLPTPPTRIPAPSPALDYFNKFNEVIIFQQNLSRTLEEQSIQNSFSQNASIKTISNEAEAISWFNG
tara:strand:+ start:1840 stop:2046 length:207 start_codon:yes stop_codon:yes gene_type:complete